MLRNLLIMIGIWCFTSFNFYLMSFQVKYLGGDIFQNTVITSISQTVAAIFGGVLYQKLGVKRTFALSFLLSMIGSTYLLHDNSPLFILLARFGCSSCFCIVYLANADIFPPKFASTVFGLCNTASRILTITAPMVAELP